MFRWPLASDGVIKHPADGDPVNIGAFDAETDQPARAHVHDQQHPVTMQNDGFAAEQVDAP